jgi:hypothetical protein
MGNPSDAVPSSLSLCCFITPQLHQQKPRQRERRKTLTGNQRKITLLSVLVFVSERRGSKYIYPYMHVYVGVFSSKRQRREGTKNRTLGTAMHESNATTRSAGE